jgi:opacity protein-like surface antigen
MISSNILPWHPNNQRDGFTQHTALEGGQMRKLLVTAALLSTVTLPAAAADMDMPAKAPWRSPEAIVSDWSGFYVGVGVGYGWGREKFDRPPSAIENMFDTGVFNDNPVLVQPGFAIPGDLTQTFKQKGYVAGGFFGAQKQFGNWVLGIEADISATGIKQSFSRDSSHYEDIKAILPNTTFTVPGQEAVVSGSAYVAAVDITVLGQTVTSTGSVAVTPQGLVLTETISGLHAYETLHAGETVKIVLTNDKGIKTIVEATLTKDVRADKDGKITLETGVGGSIKVEHNKSFTTQIYTTGGTYDVTVTGKTLDQVVTVPGQTAPVAGTAAVLPVIVIINGVPHQETVNARVDRSISMSTKIEELGSVRGKIGLAASPNWMIYGTGGLGWAHMTRTTTLTQTISAPGFDPRSNSFSSSTGDTRLGYVVGGGIDWKLSPNVVLGALYLHYEFPKGTVAFADGGNSVGFGTSRQSADVITGRMSWMVPIH